MKTKELTIKYLQKLKKNNTKSKQLELTDVKISTYLVDIRFNKDERELLFKLRSKTLLVKDNFRNSFMNNHMLCELCKLFPWTQSHPINCPELKLKLVIDDKLKISEEFIFGTVEQQLLYVKIFKQFWDLRRDLLDK